MTRHSIRFFSLFLAIVLVLSICLIPAAAVESDSSAALLAGTAGRATLTEKEQLVYDFLKENINLAAEGKQDSSVFTLDAAALRAWEQKGIQITWTKEDFGAETISNVSLVYERFFAQFDLAKVLEALVHDDPYSLYWFDKSAGVSYTYSSTGDKVGGKYVQYTMYALSFTFPVSAAYRSGSSITAINTAKASAAKAAAANAQAIVDRYSGKSDFEKLAGYRDEICKLVSYDKNAVSGSYGDPWQLIYVFDNNSATNVVCEGYAKAFQYLCDLSTFDSIRCYSVYGTVKTGSAAAAAHMWNIITMENGQNYIVDVTNCDEDTPGGLFLVGGPGSIADGYTVTAANGSQVLYRYGSTTKHLWGGDEHSILNLSAYNYHRWQYSVNAAGDTLSAVCTAPECADRDGGSITLTAGVLVADGTAKTVTVTGALKTGAQIPDIVYDCAGGCVKPGQHKASLTVEGKTISLSFVIEAAPTGTSLVNLEEKDGQITFGVRSNQTQDAVLVVAFYQNGAIVQSTISETTTANANYAFAVSGKAWNTCKVFLLQKETYAPLCANGLISR